SGMVWVQTSLDGQQPLYHKSRLYQVASIIFGTERNGFSRTSIQPMGPDPMKPVCLSKKIDNFRPSFHRLLPGDKSSLNPHNEGHEAKTRPPDSNQLARSVSFPGKAAVFLGKFPKIPECLALHQGEQL